VSLLASYAIECGYKIPMQWVSLGAESVLPYQRELIRRAFCVDPISHYGMAEGVANISPDTQGVYRVDEDFSAVEFVPRGDGTYRIVGTNYANPAFPLIRYDTGDIARLESEESRVVIDIDGRREDFIVTKSGARIGRLDHVFKDITSVREAQIVQRTEGEAEIRVVPGPEFRAAEARRIEQEMRERTGNDLDVSVVQVDSIPRTASGKLRFVVSEVGSVAPAREGAQP